MSYIALAQQVGTLLATCIQQGASPQELGIVPQLKAAVRPIALDLMDGTLFGEGPSEEAKAKAAQAVEDAKKALEEAKAALKKAQEDEKAVSTGRSPEEFCAEAILKVAASISLDPKVAQRQVSVGGINWASVGLPVPQVPEGSKRGRPSKKEQDAPAV